MCGRARGTIGRFAHLSSPRAVAQEKSPFGQAVCCRFLANATLLSPGLTWSASACHFTCDFRDGLPLPGLPWCSALSVPCASPSSSSLSASSPLCLVLRHRHCAPWTASSERPGREGINFLRSSGQPLSARTPLRQGCTNSGRRSKGRKTKRIRDGQRTTLALNPPPHHLVISPRSTPPP